MSIKWVERVEGLLFDLDGLLVNTERLHFSAYIKVLDKRGYFLNWNFSTFCRMAHKGANTLQDAIYAHFPQLQKDTPDWQEIYQEKKATYLQMLKEGNIECMPGIDRLLEVIKSKKIKCCVVTNSPREETALIRQALPQLDIIPSWVTREQYKRPKPCPDAYLVALKKFKRKQENIIGFEDSWRGLKALQNAGIRCVLISPSSHLPAHEEIQKDTICFDSFEDIPDNIDFFDPTEKPL